MPPGITIIGLGSGDSRHWTQVAAATLQQAAEIHVRATPAMPVDQLTANIHDLDITANGTDPKQALAEALVRLGRREGGVVYAVPGNPRLDEAALPNILALAQAEKLPLTIIPGISLVEAAMETLNLSAGSNLQLADAAAVVAQHHPPLEPDRPAFISGVSAASVATLQRVLLNAYPADFGLKLVQFRSGQAAQIWSCLLSDLAGQQLLDRPVVLYLPADSHSGFSAFQETIAHLRAPDGCPWDQKQTHQSLRPYLLEEAYEVLEALDAHDNIALAEELGDLLLQVVLHTQVAIDNGEFKMGDVIDHINRKLVRRHPHVFGNVTVDGVAAVTANWEAIKQQEKEAKGERAQAASALDGVPAALPALTQALSISNRAVRVGFEWPNMEGVLEKIVEEAREIAEASSQAEVASEIGDLLFSVVNLARWQQVDPESALRETNARFSRRFKEMEALARAQGVRLTDLSIDEMEALWTRAKTRV